MDTKKWSKGTTLLPPIEEIYGLLRKWENGFVVCVGQNDFESLKI